MKYFYKYLKQEIINCYDRILEINQKKTSYLHIFQFDMKLFHYFGIGVKIITIMRLFH